MLSRLIRFVDGVIDSFLSMLSFLIWVIILTTLYYWVFG